MKHFYKAFEGAGIRLPKHKQIIMTLADKDKQDGIDIAQRFEALWIQDICFKRYS